MRRHISVLLVTPLAFLVVLIFALAAIRSMRHGGYLGTIEIQHLLLGAFGCLLTVAIASAFRSIWVTRATAVVVLAIGALSACAAIWQSRRVRDVLAVLLALLTCMALGSLVLRLLRQDQRFSPLERCSLAAAIGLGLLSHLVLLLSVTGLLIAGVVVAIIVAVVFIGARDAVRQCGSLCRDVKRSWVDPPPIALFSLVAALAVLLPALVESLAPPVQYDDLNYHLLVPFRHAGAHRFLMLPDVIQSYFYQGTEMLSVLGFLLASESAAILFNLASGVIAGLGLAGLCGRLLSREAGWLAASFWFGTPLVAWLMTTGYSETNLALFCLLTFVAAFSFVQQPSAGGAALAGALGGFAMSVKPSGGIFAAITLAVALAALLIARNTRSCVQLVAWWTVGFLLTGWPWPVLRFAQTGNPTFPFLNGLFKAPGYDWRNIPFDLSRFGMGTGLPAFLRLPWNVSVHGEHFVEAMHPNVVGPSLLLAVVFAFSAARKPGGVARHAMAVAGVFLGLWFMTAQFARYLMPAMPLIVLVAALGLASTVEGIRPGGRLFALLSLGLLLVSSSLVIWMASYHNIPERVPLRVVYGRESRTDYLHRVLPVSAAYDSIRDACWAGREAVFGAANQFGYLCPSLIPWTSRRAAFIWEKKADADYRRDLRRLGVTHILIDETAGGLRGAPIESSGFLERAGTVVYSTPAFRVIRLY